MSGGLRIPDPSKIERIERERELERKVLTDLSDKFVTCKKCGFRTQESIRKANGWTACPQCGYTRCGITDLPYNTHDPRGIPIAPNPPPTEAEIAQLDRLRAPRRVR